MAVHPANDRFKVKVETDPYQLKDSVETECGVVVEVPDILIYLSFHSFAFEDSFASEEKLKKVQEYYKSFVGKKIWWEKFQDKGRRIKEADGEYIYLQMTDLLAYSDSDKEDAYLVQDTRSGSFAI